MPRISVVLFWLSWNCTPSCKIGLQGLQLLLFLQNTLSTPLIQSAIKLYKRKYMYCLTRHIITGAQNLNHEWNEVRWMKQKFGMFYNLCLQNNNLGWFEAGQTQQSKGWRIFDCERAAMVLQVRKLWWICSCCFCIMNQFIKRYKSLKNKIHGKARFDEWND